jgi:hypothetical protein
VAQHLGKDPYAETDEDKQQNGEIIFEVHD